MIGPSHLFGGFSLSPSLARRVFEAVSELQTQSVRVELSHVDDDNCEICRGAAEKTREAENHDAPGSDRPGRRWTA